MPQKSGLEAQINLLKGLLCADQYVGAGRAAGSYNLSTRLTYYLEVRPVDYTTLSLFDDALVVAYFSTRESKFRRFTFRLRA